METTFDLPDEPAVDDAIETLAADMAVTERANLATSLDEDQRKALAGRIRARFDSDVASRAPRMKRCKELQKLYAMVAETKNFPFHNAANIKAPTLTGPQLQIQSRLFDMVWPASGRIFNVLAGTIDELPLSHITEEFANSYVRYKMPNMAQGLDDSLHAMTLYGSAFRRTYWDAALTRIDSGPVALEDFVVAYRYRSVDPSMADVPRYTMIHHLTVDEIADMGSLVTGADAVKAHAGEEDHESAFRDQAQKIDGVTHDPTEDDEDRKRPVLEQHFRWKTPNNSGKHPAFDGKPHYVYALVDAWSGELLRLSLREEDDPDDLRRFQRQQQAVSEHEAAQRLVALQAPQMDPMTGAPIPPPIPPGPTPPTPKPIRKRQICFFTHLRCFPSDGFYGIGYGDVLYGLAIGLNTTINQHIDGVTLRNAKPALMSSQVRMQRGNVAVQPGSFVEVDGPIGAIRDAIMYLDPPGNDPSTVPLIQMMSGMADAMTGSADTMSGVLPKSNQTAEGVSKLIEQALTPINVLGRRVLLALTHELQKIWRCFGVFLEDAEIVDIIGESEQPKRIEISRAMFTPTARLVPASDPRQKSQRVNDHQALMGYVTQNPFIMKDPVQAAPLLRAMTEQGLRIFPDGERMMQFLPPAQPPGPPPPPPPVPYWEEDASFLNGKPSHVNQADDDNLHLQGHSAFQQTQGQMLAPPMKDALEQHLRDHIAATIRKQFGGQNGQQQQPISGGPIPPGGSPGPGPGPMAGSPDQPPPGGPSPP